MPKRKQNRKVRHLLTQSIHTHAAGIDIGAEELMASVPADLDERPVRRFDTFTENLHELRDWLLKHKITTVAMESTGTYWIPTYDILQAAGIEVCLVNARHIKGVPGKKTDVCDAQWLQHMQKALTEMNLKIHHVFSDLDGTSAMAIIEAILKGERDPEALWKLRHPNSRTKKETFLKAIHADWQPAQLFILKQCHTSWRQTRQAITQCDQAVRKHMSEVPSETEETGPTAHWRNRRLSKNDLQFDVYQEAYRYYGVDLSTIDGISAGSLTILMSELGNSKDILGNFKNAKAFASWLGLSPDNRISGGKILKSKTRRVVNRISATLRMAAQGLTNAKCAMGEYCRRMKSRLGKAEGTTAVAHKLARLIYSMIQSKQPYDEAKAFQTTARHKANRLKMLHKLAQSLDMQLTPIQTVTETVI